MIKRLIIFIVVIALVFGGLFAMKFLQIQKAIHNFQVPPPAVVAVTEVKQQLWESSLSAVGTLVAVEGVNISNEIAGIVKTIHFISGQNITKDQLLVELDYSTDQAELEGLLAKLRLAQIRFERSKKLLDKNVASKSDYDQNLALLDEAKAAVKTKSNIIEKKRIRAPFSGKLGIRKIDLGQYLSSGSDIVSLQNINPIYVDFKLPERHLSHLAQDQEVDIIVQAYPDKVFKGKVSAISPLIDQGTRSIQIRSTIINNEQLLHPGMFSKVQIHSDRTRQVLTLPDTAIAYNPYGNFVFVVESGSDKLTVQSRQVQTGETQRGRVEVVKGLSRGERVVSAGQVKLRNGMQITIDKNPAPGERAKNIAP